MHSYRDIIILEEENSNRSPRTHSFKLRRNIKKKKRENIKKILKKAEKQKDKFKTKFETIFFNNQGLKNSNYISSLLKKIDNPIEKIAFLDYISDKRENIKKKQEKRDLYKIKPLTTNFLQRFKKKIKNKEPIIDDDEVKEIVQQQFESQKLHSGVYQSEFDNFVANLRSFNDEITKRRTKILIKNNRSKSKNHRHYSSSKTKMDEEKNTCLNKLTKEPKNHNPKTKKLNELISDKLYQNNENDFKIEKIRKKNNIAESMLTLSSDSSKGSFLIMEKISTLENIEEGTEGSNKISFSDVVLKAYNNFSKSGKKGLFLRKKNINEGSIFTKKAQIRIAKKQKELKQRADKEKKRAKELEKLMKRNFRNRMEKMIAKNSNISINHNRYYHRVQRIKLSQMLMSREVKAEVQYGIFKFLKEQNDPFTYEEFLKEINKPFVRGLLDDLRASYNKARQRFIKNKQRLDDAKNRMMVKFYSGGIENSVSDNFKTHIKKYLNISENSLQHISADDMLKKNIIDGSIVKKDRDNEEKSEDRWESSKTLLKLRNVSSSKLDNSMKGNKNDKKVDSNPANTLNSSKRIYLPIKRNSFSGSTKSIFFNQSQKEKSLSPKNNAILRIKRFVKKRKAKSPQFSSSKSRNKRSKNGSSKSNNRTRRHSSSSAAHNFALIAHKEISAPKNRLDEYFEKIKRKKRRKLLSK